MIIIACDELPNVWSAFALPLATQYYVIVVSHKFSDTISKFNYKYLIRVQYYKL